MPRKLVIKSGIFYSQGDEKAFFDWLQSLSCVERVDGQLDELHIAFVKQPNNSELRELIALLHRYRLDMKPLAAFKNKRNAAWFAQNRNSYWHIRVFGKKQKRKSNSGADCITFNDIRACNDRLPYQSLNRLGCAHNPSAGLPMKKISSPSTTLYPSASLAGL